MKKLLMLTLVFASTLVAASEVKLLTEADTQKAYSVLSKTDAYEDKSLTELKNVKCEYSLYGAAKDFGRNYVYCTGESSVGKVSVYQNEGAITLYQIVKKYGRTSFTFGQSTVTAKSITCSEDNDKIACQVKI